MLPYRKILAAATERSTQMPIGGTVLARIINNTCNTVKVRFGSTERVIQSMSAVHMTYSADSTDNISAYFTPVGTPVGTYIVEAENV